MSICLSAEELYELTHKKMPSAQIRELRYLGIDFKVRGDGTPLVLRATIEGVAGQNKPAANEIEPDWDAM